jgi:hypothetical protein
MRLARSILALTLVCFALYGCASLPDPVGENSSLVILSMHIRGGERPKKVYIARTADGGKTGQAFAQSVRFFNERPPRSSSRGDAHAADFIERAYYCYANVAPGTYTIVRAETKTWTPGPRMSVGVGLNSAGDGVPRTPNEVGAMILFPGADLHLQVGERQVVFMGDFEAVVDTGKSPTFVAFNTIQAYGTGSRTREGEKEAFSEFRRQYPQSRWIPLTRQGGRQQY